MQLFKTNDSKYLFSTKKNKEKLLESKISVENMEKNNLIEKPKAMDEASKRKLITYGSIGIFVIAFLIFAVVDFNGEEKKEQEFELPETAEDKIGSKSEGIGTDTINRGRIVDLNSIYNVEEEKKDTTLSELQKKVLAAARENEKKGKEITPVEKRKENFTPRKSSQVVVYETKKQSTKKKVVPEPIIEESNSSGFFNRNKKTVSKSNTNLNVYASVHTNQTIMNGQRVKLRTTKEFVFNGKSYPINTIVYGMAQIQPNRLLIKINKINQTDMELEVYDSEDSEKGIYVLTPNLNESLKKEAQREGINDDDLRNIPFSKSLKRLFERKIKEEKVELLNNYKVIIKLYQDE